MLDYKNAFLSHEITVCFYIINLDARTMLKCQECDFEFSGEGSKSDDVIFEESCPKCGSYEIFVKRGNPVVKTISGWFVVVLFITAILLPLIWYFLVIF